MACDIKCQKDKKLKSLQDAYIAASSKAGIDPKSYEEAKIAYFSLRDGPTWLHNYKQQKAEQESEQVIRKYRQKKMYNAPVEQQIVEDDYTMIKKDQADAEWRTVQLDTNWTYWLELSLTIIFSLVIAYEILIGKLFKIMNYFS